MKNTLEQIRVLCNSPLDTGAILDAIRRTVSDKLEPGRADSEVTALLEERRERILSGQPCDDIEQKIAEKECPFKVGDVVKGKYFKYECGPDIPGYSCQNGVTTDTCRGCPIAVSERIIEKVFLVGHIAYIENFNFRNIDSHYVISAHYLNAEGRPGKPRKSVTKDDLDEYDAFPATKIGSMQPPIYYKETDKKFYTAVFPDFAPLWYVEKVKPIAVNPMFKCMEKAGHKIAATEVQGE